MINTLFDQYQRYNNVRNIINELRVDGETFRILEVGANEHRNLEKFLPLDNITYLDIQLPEELIDDPNYILGDATNMSFSDNEYDVIVALDVFEHIPEEKRNQFIDELYRVSSQICVITAPFHSQQTVDAESRVNTVYKSLFNKNFIWLEEHMDNGLPKPDILTSYLDSKNISYKMIGHGSLDIWERLMGIHFFAANNPRLGLYRQEIDKFYNSYLFDYDYMEESYRKIVILHKNGNLNVLEEKVSKEVPITILKKLEMMERTFYNLYSMMDKIIEGNLISEDQIQIFLDSGQGFNESESQSYKFKDKELTTHISIDLRNINGIQNIRIDPSNYSGIYKVENLKLFEATSNELIEYEVIGNFNYEASNIYLFEKDDPNIILNLGSELYISRLELDVSKFSEDEVVKQVINMLLSKENENIAIDQDYKKQLMRLEELHSEMEHLRVINNGMEATVEYLTERIKVAENEQQRLTTVLLAKELEIKEIYDSKAWKFVVRMRKMLGK
ncbi:class I SAM-dependent methyltransferase [Paenibacillus antarcticus]|uniref:Methyltransferase type 11 domain-containing protein n=1 Tax=Paenibacillus antarcticus TaxID=253703 RepID=A0A162K1Z9_9BACL|nr:class I SAM-dependent methyltransferase [Paenibacillus antarcticus]OAB41816.1 hypothetical protein PBAT_20755 [Paenibacillus antarcticus]